MDIFYNRQSIRVYTDQEISNDLINQIIDAGIYAPSAGRLFPWSFIVIENKEVLHKLSKISKYASSLLTANKAIIICLDTKRCKVDHKMWVPILSACTENVLLKITELGLGGVWITCYPLEDKIKFVQENINLMDDEYPFAIIALGYPNETPENTKKDRIKKVRYIK